MNEAVVLNATRGIATLRLNRPEKLNAVNQDLIDSLLRHMEAIEADANVRAVVLIGEGRAFCAGVDQSGPKPERTPAFLRARLAQHHEVMRRLWNLTKPVVAAVRGPAVGIGWSYALCCDIVLASETAQFWNPLVARGGVPDGGAIWLLARQVGALRAQDLLYSGRKLGAAEALDLGLINSLVEDSRLAETAYELARQLGDLPPLSFDLTKSLFRANAGSLEDYLRIESGHIPATGGRQLLTPGSD